MSTEGDCVVFVDGRDEGFHYADFPGGIKEIQVIFVEDPGTMLSDSLDLRPLFSPIATLQGIHIRVFYESNTLGHSDTGKIYGFLSKVYPELSDYATNIQNYARVNESMLSFLEENKDSSESLWLVRPLHTEVFGQGSLCISCSLGKKPESYFDELYGNEL